MSTYPFRLINTENDEQLKDKNLLRGRTSKAMGFSFQEDARRFVAGEELEIAINTAIAVGEPLLLTGEPGTGKTQVAYYAAYKLNLEPVIHFQVRSDSIAKDLLYHFDTVRYFHDAHLRRQDELPDKNNYVEPRALWEALESEGPRVLLIDEIDKAPREFPNDLLHESDKMEFKILETGKIVRGSHENRPIIFITSNSERRLPEPFLRRCVYHHITFDRDLLDKAVKKRTDEYPGLSEEFLDMAIDRFIALREFTLRKRPSTGELLVWLRVLGLNADHYSKYLDENLSELPYLGVLIKDHQDREDLERRRF
ncbi:MoxR family ATPase [Desulfococcaceae bacterium HSG8]|nr:MoxR family ATPase [Desulfococcaceae bacterium HSG8]